MLRGEHSSRVQKWFEREITNEMMTEKIQIEIQIYREFESLREMVYQKKMKFSYRDFPSKT